MFTGLIQEVGTIVGARPVGGGRQLTIEAPGIGPQCEVGESIAISGPCLTVEEASARGFVCEIAARRDEGTTAWFEFAIPEEYMRYLAPKGSVTVDGISLTVTEVGEKVFSVAIIPNTLANTTLADARAGDAVNVETDMLAKYVERLLERASAGASGMTEEFLAEHGFV
jgi:riboflavin synthase